MKITSENAFQDGHNLSESTPVCLSDCNNNNNNNIGPALSRKRIRDDGTENVLSSDRLQNRVVNLLKIPIFLPEKMCSICQHLDRQQSLHLSYLLSEIRSVKSLLNLRK